MQSYDWSSLFKLGEFTLVRGVDYRVGQASICQQVRNAASRYRYRVKLKDRDDSVYVMVLGRARKHDIRLLSSPVKRKRSA